MQSNPAWSPEEHLERVYRRGRQLRRRRQVGATSTVLAAAVGLASLVGGSAAPMVRPLETLAAAVRAFDNDKPVDESTATTVAEEAGLRGTRRTTTTAAGSTTTRRSARTTTSLTPAPTTTAAGGGGPAPTTAPTVVSNCRGNDVAYSTDTNKPAYRPNDDVQISLIAHNASSQPCYLPTSCGVGPWASVENLEGRVVWKNSPSSVTCPTPAPAPPKVNPGESYSYGVVATWNQLVCPNGDGCAGEHAPAGTYRVTAHRERMTAEGATFALR